MFRFRRSREVFCESVGVAFVILTLLSWTTRAQTEVATWTDRVTYRIPETPDSIRRLTRAADWLRTHTVTVIQPESKAGLRVIAWKDPTLAPENPKLLAGYVITDTLWAAKALKPLNAKISIELERSIRRLGWQGNGLHDVLFHPVERLLHRSADEDIVHGHSLGHFEIEGGSRVDLRVFRQKYDADYEVGHPHLFAEHAVYQALFDFWNGRKAEARRRILGIVNDDRGTDPNDQIFWDRDSGILVDYVNREEWGRFQARKDPTCRHFSFKLGVLLYAVQLMGLDQEFEMAMEKMNTRLWSAQAEDGGIAHFVEVRHDGQLLDSRRDSTGEATAIAILSKTVKLPLKSDAAK
jgi:hypothetical protein